MKNEDRSAKRLIEMERENASLKRLLADHERFANELDLAMYFAEPYRS